MKPLLKKDLPAFLERFGNFIDSEFRHVDIVSPTVIKITLAGQDSARGFDWITVEFEFNGVSDVRLLDNSKLPHVDMGDGISIIYEDGLFAFGIGEYTTISSLKSSTFQITSSSLKYQEGQF